jgi:hypothetical protein
MKICGDDENSTNQFFIKKHTKKNERLSINIFIFLIFFF